MRNAGPPTRVGDEGRKELPRPFEWAANVVGGFVMLVWVLIVAALIIGLIVSAVIDATTSKPCGLSYDNSTGNLTNTCTGQVVQP